MKCAICNQKIEETFLKKIKGTYIRDKKSKRQSVCQNCQKKLTPEEIKEKL